MAPSPNKHKTVHKSSGKIFRQKEKDKANSESSNKNTSFQANGTSMSASTTNGNFQVIRKDEILDLKECPLTLPDVTPLDTAKSLPRYMSLANGEGVQLEEIDGLQLELELLLSSIMVRQLVLSNQLEVIAHLEKGRLPPKMAASPGKRSKQNDNDKPFKKLRDISTKTRDPNAAPGPPPGSRPPKVNQLVKCSVVQNEPLFDVPDIGPAEEPKPSPIKNDISNRFWTMVDQYCQEMTADTVKMLEDMLNAQAEDGEYMKIPPLGKHYSLRWAQEDLMDEQKESSKMADSKKKMKSDAGSDLNDKMLKELNGCNDDVAPMGPLTQRIVSGLVEENILMSENIENKVQGVGNSRPGLMKSFNAANAASLEKRIKKELQEQGILDLQSEDEDDEILSELKRCQSELKAVSAYNRNQLNRLLRLSRDALVRHDLKKKLRDADAKVIENYRSITSNKQKKKPPSKKDKELAIKSLKDREALVRQLDLLANSSN